MVQTFTQTYMIKNTRESKEKGNIEELKSVEELFNDNVQHF